MLSATSRTATWGICGRPGRGDDQRAALLRPRRGLHVQRRRVQPEEGSLGAVSAGLRGGGHRRPRLAEEPLPGHLPRPRRPGAVLPEHRRSSTCRRPTLSFLVPVGNGLTLKAGKWVTLIGYEVYESPKNLNFSRDFLYTLATPYTHTGALATYPFVKWLTVTLGFTNGWDAADNNNGYLRAIGQIAFTPSEVLDHDELPRGPRAEPEPDARGVNNRWIVDTTVLYTGIDSSPSRPISTSRERRRIRRWSRGGRAPRMTPARVNRRYVAYDWTEGPPHGPARRVLQRSPGGPEQRDCAPLQFRPAGHTATVEYKILRGLVGRLEHATTRPAARPSASEPRATPSSHAEDTMTVASSTRSSSRMLEVLRNPPTTSSDGGTGPTGCPLP